MHIVNEKNGNYFSLSSKEIKPPFSPLARKILNMLAEKPSYAKELAEMMRIHEQKVYYHVRILESMGLIRILRREERGGVLAKIYTLTRPSFFIKFKDFEKTEKIPKNVNEFLYPFVDDGKLNAKIVVGSPDPHGPEKARSRDAYYGIDLGMFLGTFLKNAKASVALDTDLRQYDLRDNLIIIGGPVINRITKQVNDTLPVKFDNKRRIYSNITKKLYRHDENGLIVKTKNPFDKDKKILVIAGRRYSGTRAAILAFLNKFDDIQVGNKNKFAHVVEGVDNDGDGIIDDVKILE
ncbi:S-layer protein [Candidatus Aenigmatarchaeota archaeon]